MSNRIRDANPLENAQTQEKHQELAIVPSANACSKPLAMMIKPVHTVSTKVAMESSFWSVYVTGVTILESCDVSSSLS